jgi:hypothetical protein
MTSRKSPPKSQSEIGSLPQKSEDAFGDIESFYPINKAEVNFLQEYNKDLDIERALKASGLKKKALNPHTDQGQALLNEMREINIAWTSAIKMNSPAAAKKHLELMEKFEADYDGADLKNQNKSGLASTLAKMSSDNLKATGHFGNQDAGGGTKVEINIDLGGSDKTAPDIIIEGGDAE